MLSRGFRTARVLLGTAIWASLCIVMSGGRGLAGSTPDESNGGLLHHWSFDEKEGDLIADALGRSGDAKASRPLPRVRGVFGQALDLHGTYCSVNLRLTGGTGWLGRSLRRPGASEPGEPGHSAPATRRLGNPCPGRTATGSQSGTRGTHDRFREEAVINPISLRQSPVLSQILVDGIAALPAARNATKSQSH